MTTIIKPFGLFIIILLLENALQAQVWSGSASSGLTGRTGQVAIGATTIPASVGTYYGQATSTNYPMLYVGSSYYWGAAAYIEANSTSSNAHGLYVKAPGRALHATGNQPGGYGVYAEGTNGAGGLYVNGSSYMNGSTYKNGTLTVTGATTLNNTLTVAGVTTLNNTLMLNAEVISNGPSGNPATATTSRGFRVGSTTGDNRNGAPWYGLGMSNQQLLGESGGNAVQVAGFNGIGFSTRGSSQSTPQLPFDMTIQNGNVCIGTQSTPDDADYSLFVAQGVSANKIRVATDMTIQSGNVCIGTQNTPDDANYSLFVAQGVYATKVKVATGWADYVFRPGYQLLALEAVADSIAATGHLPGVQSEADVTAAGGIELGQTTVQQQEKIEELYLHLIRMNEELKALKAENQAMSAKIQSLKK